MVSSLEVTPLSQVSNVAILWTRKPICVRQGWVEGGVLKRCGAAADKLAPRSRWQGFVGLFSFIRPCAEVCWVLLRKYKHPTRPSPTPEEEPTVDFGGKGDGRQQQPETAAQIK